MLRPALWAVMAAAIVPTKADPDLWGNLRFGSDLLATRSFSTVDPYSFTQDVPWVNHEWFPQVVMAAAYSIAGAAGLVLLKVVLVAVVLWLVFDSLRDAAFPVPELGAGLVLFAALPLVATVRAQLWTFAALAILCRMVISHDRRVMLGAPLLFILWVNCHVGWIIGIAVLTWWGVGRWLRGDSGDRRRAIVIISASIVATLLNPYGWHTWEFVTRVAHLSRSISEWEPLWRAHRLNQLAFVTCIIVVTIFYRRERRHIQLERLICIAGLAYASVRALKFVDLFVVTSVVFISPAVVSAFAIPRTPARGDGRSVRAISALVAAVLIAVVIASGWRRATCLPSDDWRPDPIAARSLMAAHPRGRIAVTFDWGEYVIWHFGPTLRVSYDPRYDLIYSPRTIAEQESVRFAAPDGIRFLERTKPEYVWFRRSDQALKVWLSANGYRIDVETDASFVAVRGDLDSLPRPPDGDQPPFGCFPSP